MAKFESKFGLGDRVYFCDYEPYAPVPWVVFETVVTGVHFSDDDHGTTVRYSTPASGEMRESCFSSDPDEAFRIGRKSFSSYFHHLLEGKGHRRYAKHGLKLVESVGLRYILIPNKGRKKVRELKEATHCD